MEQRPQVYKQITRRRDNQQEKATSWYESDSHSIRNPQSYRSLPKNKLRRRARESCRAGTQSLNFPPFRKRRFRFTFAKFACRALLSDLKGQFWLPVPISLKRFGLNSIGKNYTFTRTGWWISLCLCCLSAKKNHLKNTPAMNRPNKSRFPTWKRVSSVIIITAQQLLAWW